MLLSIIDDMLGTLNDRERNVLRLRFGLEDGRSRTLKEVRKEFDVTGERIRQIEAKALRKLRHPSRSLRLHNLTILPESRRHPGLRGYVNLQAAIFGADPADFYRGYGLTCFLPQPKRRCKTCGASLDEFRGGARLCPACRTVPIVCDVCGKVVMRSIPAVLAAAKRGAVGQFCGRVCHGIYLGRGWGRDRTGYTWEGLPDPIRPLTARTQCCNV